MWLHHELQVSPSHTLRNSKLPRGVVTHCDGYDPPLPPMGACLKASVGVYFGEALVRPIGNTCNLGYSEVVVKYPAPPSQPYGGQLGLRPSARGSLAGEGGGTTLRPLGPNTYERLIIWGAALNHIIRAGGWGCVPAFCGCQKHPFAKRCRGDGHHFVPRRRTVASFRGTVALYRGAVLWRCTVASYRGVPWRRTVVACRVARGRLVGNHNSFPFDHVWKFTPKGPCGPRGAFGSEGRGMSCQ